MSAIETAVENLIQFHIDQNDFITRADVEQYYEEQDFVCRLDAEQYTDGEINDVRGDMEGEFTELQHRIEALEGKEIPAEIQEHIYELEHRIEALEGKPAPAAEEQDENLLQELADSAPRAVNQIDWIMTHHDLIAGYDSKAMLESYVRSMLPADQSHQAEMLIAMVLTTARNMINKKLEDKA